MTNQPDLAQPVELLLAQRTFSERDQLRFAEISGDRNPIHLDPLSARKSLAKKCVVHGIHAVFWALDALLSHVPSLPDIGNIKVRFEKMLFLHIEAQASLVTLDERFARIDIRQASSSTVTVLIKFGEPTDVETENHAECLPHFVQPLEKAYSEVGTGASVVLCADHPLVTAFPRVARHLGPHRLRALATSSYVVGMVCPGRWSIYRALDLTACRGGDRMDFISFRITNHDSRFRLMRCRVDGAGWTGFFDAHDAPEPVSQPSMDVVSKAVVPNEFIGINALVIGGSRGLGELLAKLLAAGGAKILLTYHVGQEDALRVQNEILNAGREAAISRYDVSDDLNERIDLTDFHQIYFMAAPPINKTAERIETSIVKAYESIFVDAFARLCTQVAARSSSPISIFYPSSVFVEQTPDGFAAYARAKRRGEEICASLQADIPNGRILMQRLPAILTDQTNSLIQPAFANAIDIMLPIARAMRLQSFAN